MPGPQYKGRPKPKVRRRTAGSPSITYARPQRVRRQERKATKRYEAKPKPKPKNNLAPSYVKSQRKSKRAYEKKQERQKVQGQRARSRGERGIRRARLLSDSLMRATRKAEREFVRENKKADSYARTHGYKDSGARNRANQAKTLTEKQILERNQKQSSGGVLQEKLDRSTQPLQTGALNLLEESTRPIHGVAGGAHEAVQGKNVSEGFKRGVMLKSPPDEPEDTPPVLFSDVLKKAGVKNKYVAAVGGFGLDTTLDFSNWVTLGTGSVAAKAARVAGRKALKRRAAERAAGALPAPKVKPTAGKAAKAAKKAYRKARVGGAAPAEAKSAAQGARKIVGEAQQARRVKRLDTRAGHRAQRKARAKAGNQRGIQARAFGRTTSGKTTGKLGKLLDIGTPAAAAAHTAAVPTPKVRERKGAAAELEELKARPPLTQSQKEALIKATMRGEAPKVREPKGAAPKPTKPPKPPKTRVTVADKPPGGPLNRTAREFQAEVSPHTRPSKSIPVESFRTAKAVAREQRAAAMRGSERAIARAEAIQKKIPEADRDIVIDALERKTVYTLPDRLRAPAEALVKEAKRARRAELKAGIKTPQVQGMGYYSHLLDDVAEAGGTGPMGRVGATIAPKYAKQRAHRGTVKKIAEEGGPQFSTNIGLVTANRLKKSAADTAKATHNKALVKAGRVIHQGDQVHIGPDEAVYGSEGAKMAQVNLSDAAERKALSNSADGDITYVVLNKRFADKQLHAILPGADRTHFGLVYDRATGAFKWMATVPNPGFHARNWYGDTWNAYLDQGAARLAKSTVQSARVLRRIGRQEKANRDLVSGKPKPLGGHITIKDDLGRKQKISLDQLARDAQRSGGVRQGYIARELPELLQEQGTAVAKLRTSRAHHGLQSVGRGLRNREDLMRGATYIGARKGPGWGAPGLASREAAGRVVRQHFDYGDLSEFERIGMRRAMPFYTFTARNIPLQAKSLLTHPGKFANVQKFREEVAKAQGIDLQEWEDNNLRGFQKRALPVPLKLGEDEKGNPVIFAISPGASGLPLTDLNQFPIPGSGATPESAWTEWGDKLAAMLNPIIRSPVELKANYNFFFKGEIDRDNAPMVPAPSYVAMWPEAMRKKLGVKDGLIDKRSGKKGWGWPARLDYASKVLLPGPPGQVQSQQIEAISNRGQTRVQKLISYGTGVRPDKTEKITPEIDKLYDHLNRLNKEQAALDQYGKGNTTAGLKKKALIKKVENRITRLSKARGDKNPLMDRTKGGQPPADPGAAFGGPPVVKNKNKNQDPGRAF